jgi:hypothetical protein
MNTREDPEPVVTNAPRRPEPKGLTGHVALMGDGRMVEGVVLRTGREARCTAPRVQWLVDYLEWVATTTMRGESSPSSEPDMSE